MIDVWQRKRLTSMQEIAFAAEHTPLDNIVADLAAMNSIMVGTGEKNALIVVDPYCGENCNNVIEQLKPLSKDYTFHVLVVPAFGDKSNKAAKALFCAEDKTNALKHLVDETLHTLKQKKNCDIKGYDHSLMTAQLIGVKAVPHLIAPDGRSFKGFNTTFSAWLKNEKPLLLGEKL